MELTQISPYKNQYVSGYMLNSGFSQASQNIVADLNHQLLDKFSEVISPQPKEALHVTLMDWVAPLVDYEQGHDNLFQQVFPEYDRTLTAITNDLRAFAVQFDTIKVSPAAIYIEGHDNGQFSKVRETFLQNATLPPGTKQPPAIVHCTIARFNDRIAIESIHQFVSTLTIDINQSIDGFRLVHETHMPMLEYEIIKTYQLTK